MTQPFLIEVGCEEIPARFLAALSGQLLASLGEELQTSGLRIADADLHAAYTPRRLAAWTDKILDRQSDLKEETIGPPVKAAYDAQGSPTPAAVNFARKFGATVDDLYKINTPKGEYIALQRKIIGKTAQEILPEIILNALNNILSDLDNSDSPRSMKWDESGFKFIRPVRWLVVLLGDEVIPMQLGNVASGRQTRGHRTLGSQAIELKRADGNEFLRLLEKNFVLARPEARRERIRSGLLEQTPENGLRAVDDAELLEILVNLTEYPTVIRGAFDRQYLELPREVLVTVMRSHQRYFALEEAREGDRLAPGFLAVANQDQDRDGLIRQGHERVLRARFNDALFFWRHDRKRSLESRLEDLKHITFHAKLGSYYDKTQRMMRLVDPLCEALKITEHQGAVRAAMQLAKCDLSTDLVKEFTELQGQIGGRIAQAEGQDETIWSAIYDHYLPLGSEDKIPRNLAGAAVALADKLDTLASMFSIGEIPSGSRDPYALRRAGNGVVRILIEFKILLNLSDFINQLSIEQKIHDKWIKFIKERQEYYFEIHDYPREEVRAVLYAIRPVDLSGKNDDPCYSFLRIHALHEARREKPETFSQAAEVFKRLRNIVLQAGDLKKMVQKQFDKKLFTENVESELHDGIGKLANLPKNSEYTKNYLLNSAQLSSVVDQYFKQVRVNDSDLILRENRLAFLAWATLMLGQFADLGMLSE